MAFATRAGIVLLASALSACAAGSGVHIEPQVPPVGARALVHSPIDPQLVLITEASGALSLWRFPDASTPERLATVFIDAHLAAFSADGTAIIAAGQDGRLRILGFDGESMAESRDAGDLPGGLAVDPAGGRIVTAGRDGVWSWSLPDLSRTSIEPNVQASAAAFSVNGELAVGYSTGSVRIISEDGKRDVRLPGHEDEIRSLAFLPSSGKLVSSSSRSARLWSWKESTEGAVLVTASGGESTVDSVIVDPAGEYFAAVTSDEDEDGDDEGGLYLWNANGVRVTTRTMAPIASAGLLPRGSLVVVTPTGLQTFQLSFERERTPLPSFCSAAYSRERDRLAVACQQGVWIVPGHTLRPDDVDALLARPPLFPPLGKRLFRARFLAGGTHLAVLHDDASATVWQLDNPNTPPTSFSLNTEGDEAVDFAASGSLLAVAGASGTVRIWDLSGNPYGQPIATGQPLSRIALSADGTFVASGGSDGTVAVWSSSAPPQRPVSTGLSEITALEFSPDARTVLAADTSGSGVEITLDGKPGKPFKGIDGSALRIAFSTDGRLAFGKTDGDIAVRAADGQVTQLRWGDSDDMVDSVRFAPGDTRLVAILVDDRWSVTTVGLWQPTLGDPKASLARSFSEAPALSGSGDTVLSARTSWNLLDGQVSSVGDGEIVYSPGVRFMALREGNDVRVRNVAGTDVRDTSVPAVTPVLADTGRLAYIDAEGTLFLEHADGRFAAQADAGRVGSVVGGPGGRWFAARNDGTLTVWNADGTPAQHPLSAAPPLETRFARAMAVSPDGSRVAIVDRQTGIWLRTGDGTSGPIRLSSLAEYEDVRQVVFCQDGGAVAAITSRGRLFYWDVEDRDDPIEWRGGVSVWQAGPTEDGLWAATSSGELHLLNRRLETLARVVTTNDGAVAITRDGRYAGHGVLYQRTRLYTKDLTRLGESDAVRQFSLERVRLTMTRQLGWWALTRDAVVATTTMALVTYGGLPTWAKAGFWPTALYIAVLVTMVGMWIVVPGRVAALAMPSYTGAELPAWRLATDTLSLTRWLGHTGRALDGWLAATRQEQLARGFEGRGAIQKRSVYVDLGNEHDVAAWTAAMAAGAPAHFWVSGPGGCGKSTLAFHLARLALQSGRRRPVIPVVVDSDWSGSLLDHVAEALRQGSRRPTVAMVRRLAYTGRLVLVIDGLSERRSDDARAQVLALIDASVLRYLIVTARGDTPERDEVRQVTVGPLEGERLEAYVAAYVDEDRRAEALASLSALSQGRPIRPLFATIALEWLARGDAIPDNYAGLIHTYVQHLCPRGDGALREDDFLRAARLVAFASVKDGWTPRAVSREFARGQLDAEPLPFLSAADRPAELSASVVIDQLVQCGLVEQLSALAVHEIRFSFDPVAEYLAAMHVVTLERVALTARLPESLPDTPFAEALRSIRGAAVI